MKTIIFALLCMSCLTSYAGDTSNSSSGVNAQSGSNSTNAGNSQNITFTSPPNTTSTNQTNVNSASTINGDQTIRNAPNVNAPNLVTSNDTCAIAMSGGVSIIGVGASFGTAYVDKGCERLKLSRELFNYGMRAASLALLCNDKDVKQALHDTGYECPVHKKEEAVTEEK
jgi:hypothetical protein